MSVQDSETATLAVIASQLDYARRDIAALTSKVDASAAANVSRGEWIQRNQTVDDRFASYGREIGQLRAAQAAARAPWWSVGALVVSALALAYTMFGL